VGRDYQVTKSYSEKFAGTIDEEVKALMDRAYDRCAQILKENEAKIMEIVEFLLEHETMSGAQFRACMEGKPIPEEGSTMVFFENPEDSQEDA
jgi:cell division protease FtsH